jgi:hypothetical protein
MKSKNKQIRLSRHAKEQLKYRGCSEDEVIEAIRTEKWQPAEYARLECQKDFPYNKEWNRKIYAIKRIRPIFVEEKDEIVVVTVYTYYF